jgi:nitrate reductase NapA
LEFLLDQMLAGICSRGPQLPFYGSPDKKANLIAAPNVPPMVSRDQQFDRQAVHRARARALAFGIDDHPAPELYESLPGALML